MKKTYIFYFVALSVNLCLSQVINPVSATTTATNITGSLSASYDQTGLIDKSVVLSNHSEASTDNSFSCNCMTPVFDFNLGGSYNIDGIILWNAGDDGDNIYTDDGVNSVKFYSSTDGTNYTEINGGPISFEESSVVAANNWEISAQTKTFNSVKVTHIRMEVLSNFSGLSHTGFAEIAFTTGGILSTDDYSLKNIVKLVPNPSSEHLQIRGLRNPLNFKIHNTLGVEIKSGRISNNEQISIKDFNNGLYFLVFSDGNTIKFIKE